MQYNDPQQLEHTLTYQKQFFTIVPRTVFICWGYLMNLTYILLLTLTISANIIQAGDAAAGEGPAGAGTGAGAVTSESTLPEPKRPTFVIKSFPGADSVPNFNPATGGLE